MTKSLLKFTEIDKKMPSKRTPDDRTSDFSEIYHEFDTQGAHDQASRCSQCGVPFCHIHCPLENNIPDWLMLTAEGRLEEAYYTAAATNNMPEICGRICPQDRLCEGNCVIEKDFQSVTIGSVEKYLTETAFENGWVAPIEPITERPESVGIIGAGPAGMAAAEQLRLAGFQVTLYDRYDRAGGLMMYGIPGFKLEKPVVTRRIKRLEDGGVIIKTKCNIGEDISFSDLHNTHDSVLIATGVYKPRDIQCPGVGLKGVEPALDFLIAANRRDLGDTLDPLLDKRLSAEGRHVVVIGGGDTAMDCVRTAIRQKAASVTCLYRRDRDNMPGSAREVANAEEEGVIFRWLSSPQVFLGDNNDHVTAVRTLQMRLGPEDATGRRGSLPIEGAVTDLKADLVIKALGFEAEDLPTLFNQADLPVTRWGTVLIDHKTQMTAMPGVFAAGDIVRGASLVVWGIKDGRDAAKAIADYIEAQKAEKHRVEQTENAA